MGAQGGSGDPSLEKGTIREDGRRPGTALGAFSPPHPTILQLRSSALPRDPGSKHLLFRRPMMGTDNGTRCHPTRRQKETPPPQPPNLCWCSENVAQRQDVASSESDLWCPRPCLELLQDGLLTRSGPALVDSITRTLYYITPPFTELKLLRERPERRPCQKRRNSDRTEEERGEERKREEERRREEKRERKGERGRVGKREEDLGETR